MFLLAGSAQGGGPALDDPKGRAKANREWFGTPCAEYLDFKAQAARKEVENWAASFPKAPALRQATLAAPGPRALAAPALTWVNLGPFDDAAASRDVDSGRPSAVLALPNNVLLLATSGGGVFRCQNANPNLAGDWVWEAVTDNLPASSATGNVAVGDLALSPDGGTLFLGLGDAFDATGRGFYRSTDTGTTWVPSAVAGAGTRVYDIRPVSSGPAGVVLLGTDDGLKRSIDGGATFQNVTGPLATGNLWSIQRLSATDVIASRKELDTAAAAPGAGTLYWSADAGATWTQATLDATVTALATGSAVLGRMTLATSAASATQAWGLVQVKGTSDTLAQGLLTSSDKGHTWSFRSPSSPSAPGTLFKGTGNQMDSDGQQGFYNQLLTVNPANSNQLVVGANLATYRSQDGGATWEQLTHWYGSLHPYAHADAHSAGWSPDGGTLYVCNDGGLAVYKAPWRSPLPTTTDLSFLDNGRNKGISSHLVYNLGSTLAANVADGRFRISLGCQDIGTRIRQGSGNSLQASGDFTDQVGGDGFATLYHQGDGNQVLASVYYTKIKRSIDGGASFSASIAGITEAGDENKAPFTTRLAQGWADATGNTVYTCTNGIVYQSVDFGAHWAALGTSGLPAPLVNPGTASDLFIRNLGAAKGDAQALGLAANGSRVYLTYNGGGTWSKGGSLPGSASYLSSIAFDAVLSQTVYVASVAPSATANHLWKSTNGGLSFTALDGSATSGNGFPFGVPVHIVQPDLKIANKLYVGTDFGVYQSDNAGASWTRLGVGLPLVATRDLYVAPDGSFLRAATFGRGVWETALAAGVAVSFSPGAATTVAPGSSTPFSAAVTGFQSNNQVSWSDGGAGGQFAPGTTASGAATSYTAPATPRLVTLTATSVEKTAATATLALQVYSPASLATLVTPANHVMVGGEVFTFGATVTGAPSPEVTWSASGGTITAAGVFTAPVVASGSQVVTLSATSPYAGAGRTGTATVTVKSLDLVAPAGVGLEDLAFLAYAWGTATPAAKLTDGATVTDADLTAFLAHF